ncbi:MAG: hypothetical protein ABEK42_04445, partial [Thiohalorhabdaceae bacterium]
MPDCIRIGALAAALFLAAPAALAQNGAGDEGAPTDGGKSEETNGVTKELKDLGREIRRAMREHGEYAGERLSKLGEEGRSWLGDRALQARVKTTLMG